MAKEPLTIRRRIRRFARKLLKWWRDDPAPFAERYEVGRRTYGEPNVLDWGDGGSLRVGAFCSIAQQVTIFLGGNHRHDWITAFPFATFNKRAAEVERDMTTTKGDVIIGNDVWIGHGATILSGVRIGDGAVIGACAVVTKEVPPYAIVAGNPAKLIRRRFSDSDIERLLEIAWWNWSHEKIMQAMPHLLSADIQALASFAETDKDEG